LSSLLGTPLRRHVVAIIAVAGLSLLITGAFGQNEFCPPPGPTTGYGYGYGYGYDFGYGYGSPCPTATPTASPTATPTASPTTSPTASPAAVGTITLLDSDGNATTSFEIGEDDNTAVLDNLIAGTYQIDFAQSPGEIIGTGSTNAQGDARILFDIPSTARAGSATLTFLRGTTTDRTMGITILGQATSTAVPAPTTTTQPTSGIPTLPRTGAQILTFFVTALALIALGVVLRLSIRRQAATVGGHKLPTWFASRQSTNAVHRGLAATRYGKLPRKPSPPS
jgi:hypothetical protein